MYSSSRCFQLSLRFIKWFHCSVSLATSRRMLRVSCRFWSSASKAAQGENQISSKTSLKLPRKLLYEPTESLVSDTGGSLATYCLPLNKLLSTIGLLSSSCLLNALWSSWKGKQTKEIMKSWHFTVAALSVEKFLNCIRNELSRDSRRHFYCLRFHWETLLWVKLWASVSAQGTFSFASLLFIRLNNNHCQNFFFALLCLLLNVQITIQFLKRQFSVFLNNKTIFFLSLLANPNSPVFFLLLFLRFIHCCAHDKEGEMPRMFFQPSSSSHSVFL